MSSNSNENSNSSNKKEPLFRQIDADDPVPETTRLESLCMNCYKKGYTQLLLTKIPFFKEIVLMSFKCDSCGFENNEVQSASEIQKKGIRIVLEIKTEKDLNRRIVRSDFTSVHIPEVELEIPSQSQKGEVTTVEGIIDRTIRGLLQEQDQRRIEHPDAALQIDDYVSRLKNLKDLKTAFTLKLEDISGNSFIENPDAPKVDHNCMLTHFERNKEQNQLLGLYDAEDIPKESNENDLKEIKENEQSLLKPIPEGSWPIEELTGEVLQFQTLCAQCRSPCETNMKVTNIPHFKEVIIMATNCDVCGSRTNEVKSGSGIEDKGSRFEVKVVNKEDLTRDVLKSETCSLIVPELDCEVGSAALGGRFSTVEGIFVAMKEQLEGSGSLFDDSADNAAKERLKEFLKKFDDILSLKISATLILDDPAGNSYVQSLRDDDQPDDKLKIIRYERNFDQNEELGLNDIKTENY